MRIGLVCPYDLGRPGGVQTQVLELASLLAGAGEFVTVFGPNAGKATGTATTPYQTIAIGRVRPINANGSVVPLALGSGIARRIREAAEDLDVLHIHEPLMPMVGPAALRAGRPVVATFHAQPPGWTLPAYRLSPKRWFKRAILTAVSSEAARAPAGLGSVKVIPNGFHIGSYGTGTAKLPKRVVFLGRDEPRKGLSVLVAAWSRVREIHPDASLVVIGANSFAVGAPAPSAHDLGGSDAGIDFRGRVTEEEKRRLLGEASILAAPNLGGESFGMILIEGMAAGCAVIASDIPAFRAVAGDAAELIQPGKPGELAEAIIRLLANPPTVVALSRAGRERARTFDWSLVLPQYRACYQEAVGTFYSQG